MKQLSWVFILLAVVFIVLLQLNILTFWFALLSVICGFSGLVMFIKNYFDNRN